MGMGMGIQSFVEHKGKKGGFFCVILYSFFLSRRRVIRHASTVCLARVEKKLCTIGCCA